MKLIFNLRLNIQYTSDTLNQWALRVTDIIYPIALFRGTDASKTHSQTLSLPILQRVCNKMHFPALFSLLGKPRSCRYMIAFMIIISLGAFPNSVDIRLAAYWTPASVSQPPRLLAYPMILWLHRSRYTAEGSFHNQDSQLFCHLFPHGYG